MPNIAKLFMSGKSQAVRLPAAYRFQQKEVFIRRDPITGDVILSCKPQSWQEYFELLKQLDLPKEFLDDRSDASPQKRGLF